MSKGTRSDFGAARPSGGRPAYPETAAERRVPGAERIAALAALVESITEQLDAIEGSTRRPAARGAAARPMAEPPREPLAADRLGQIEARLAAIASQMAAIHSASPAASSPAASPVAGFDTRQRALDAEADRFAAPRSLAVEEALATLRGDVATLARRIASEGRRSEEMDKALRAEIAAHLEASPREDGSRFEEVRRHLDEIRQSIASSARETTLASIEAGYSHVIERLDEITRRVPERARVDQLAMEIGRLAGLIDRVQPFRSMEGELEDIRNQIATFAATRSDHELEREIAGLRHAVEHLADLPRETVDLLPLQIELATIRREVEGFAKGTDPILLVRLEQQVAAMHGMMDQLANGGSLLSRIEDRIDALSGRFDAIIDLPALQDHADADRAVVAAIDGLRGEIGSLRSHVVDEAPLRFDQIDRQMQQLMERLDAASERDDRGALARLEAEVARLAETLAEPAPAPDAFARVEADIARLQGLIGESRSESMDTARSLVRDALAEFASQLPSLPDEALIRSLREDLGSLRAAALDADSRNHDTLETVRETLARLVDRIARMEAQQPVAADEPETRVDAPILAHRFGDLPEDHRPLAPGSGRPDLARRSDRLPTGPLPADAPPRAADRKADFIAAARRAAQAAQIEAEKAEKSGFATQLRAEEDEEKVGSGRLARFGNLLRRRRSVALAIAAVLLAIGAARHAGAPADSLPPVASVPLDRTVTGSIPDRGKAALSAPHPMASPLAFAPPTGLSSPFSPDAEAPAEAGPASAMLDIAAVTLDATAGDPLAAFELGKAYADGIGVARNLALAAQWYSQSARAGLAVAQYRAGSLFERGEGVPRDLALAETWYRKASNQGNVRATHNLAVLLSEGANAAPDYLAAARLFTLAAELGLADSQYNLGVLYGRGLGVKVDPVQSYKWFALAAQQGDADAGRRRDEVAKALAPDDLASARAAVQAFRPQPLDRNANLDPLPRPDWLQTALTAVPLDKTDRSSGKG